MGKNVFQVAEDLNITISIARKYHNFFLRSEVISPERKKEVTEFLEEGYRAEREEAVSRLFSSLPETRRRISERGDLEKERLAAFRQGVRLARDFDFRIIEALFFLSGSLAFEHWDPEGSMRLIDWNQEICEN